MIPEIEKRLAGLGVVESASESAEVAPIVVPIVAPTLAPILGDGHGQSPRTLTFHPFTMQEMRGDCDWANDPNWQKRSVLTRFGPLDLRARGFPEASYHAYLLVQWLRVIGDVPLTIACCDLEIDYPAFCTVLGLEPVAWQAVSKFVRRFTGGRRASQRIDGIKREVFYIPEQGKRCLA